MGSVLGTLILGFYLLPHFGTRAIIFSLSFILLALTALLVFIDTDNNKGPNSVMPLIVVGLFTAALSINGFAKINDNVKGFKVLHEEESIYGWVRVVDDLKNGFRLLLSDASVLSAFEISTARSLLSYQWVLGALPQFRPEAKQALLIGLGGGHVAKDLKSKGIPTDTIEIDPAVAKASIDYFNFQPTGDFIVGDARYEIKKINKKYDFIIHDCFTGGTEPTHLLTVEMLNELRGLLTNQGILALNYVGFTKGEGSNAVKSVFNTLSKVLPNIRIFITEKEEFTDFIFLASSQALNLDSNSTDRRVQWLLDHEFSFNDLTGAITITDDFNPLESMQVRKSEYYRKLFMERIDSDLLLIL